MIHALWKTDEQKEGLQAFLRDAREKRATGDEVGALCVEASGYYSVASFLRRRKMRLLNPANAARFGVYLLRARRSALQAWRLGISTVEQHDVCATVLVRTGTLWRRDLKKAWECAQSGLDLCQKRKEMRVEEALMVTTYLEVGAQIYGHPLLNPGMSHGFVHKVTEFALGCNPGSKQDRAQLSRVQRRLGEWHEKWGYSLKSAEIAVELRLQAQKNAELAGATSQL